MLGDGKPNSGTQGSYFKYQYGVLKLLESINGAVAVLGPDNEARTTRYEVVAGPTAPGAGYSIGDFLVRYDIINTATSVVTSTIWFNQTLQTTLAGAGNPNPVDIVPAAASLSTTVLNPFNLEATQLSVLAALGPLATEATLLTLATEATLLANNALLTSIDGDTSMLDVLLSTRASEATLLATNSLLTTIDADTSMLDVLLSTRASEATLLATNALLTTIDVDTSNLDVLLSTRASEATLLATNVLLGTIDADTSNLDVLLSTRASEATLAALNAKLAADFGASAGSVRTAAQIGNAAGAADFGAGAPSAQTLRTEDAASVRTPGLLSTSAAASVAAGAKSVSFANVGAAAGTVLAVSVPAGATVNFTTQGNDTLGAIAYSGVGTTLLISEVR